MSTTAPVQLFIGSGTSIEQAITSWASTCLGNNREDTTTKRLIETRRHPSFRLLTPGKGGYKRADLEGLFEEAYRSRHAKDPLLFIIDKVEELNAACANSLLKLFEEPPTAVFFALIAPSREAVLPTIASRAVVTFCNRSTHTVEQLMLYRLFCSPTNARPQDFVKACEEAQLDDVLSQTLLDALYLFWQQQYTDAVKTGNEQAVRLADRMLRALSAAIDKPPMPGSLTIFWRMLFVSIAS